MIAAPPQPAFHVNLGDLPTWLGVAAASVAAIFVYLQLRSQQKEIARQVASLSFSRPTVWISRRTFESG